jgi:hypothetical protein
MLKDRGRKKWQGFFMPEHVSILKRVNRDSHKHPKPELDPLQIEEMEQLLLESVENRTLLEVTIWSDGFFNKRVGIVKKLNAVDKKITFIDELDCTFNLSFYSITNVEKL